METIWIVIGVLLPLLLGWAFSMLGLTTPDFKNARVLCRASFLILAAWTLVWVFLTPADLTRRICVVVAVGLANAIGLPLCMAYIARRESAYVTPASLEPPALEVVEEELVNDIDLSIKPSDPRLTISVEHLRERGITPATGVIIRNVGGSEAHNLRLADFKAAKHKITFPSNIPVLAAGESTQPIVPTIKHFGALQLHDMVRAMMDDWGNQEEGIPEILYFPASATYDDYVGHHFKTSWQYEFHPLRYRNRQSRLKKGTNNFVPDTIGPYLTVSAVKTERWEGDQ